MMTELKPCPFCGGNAVFRETSIGRYGDYRTIDFVIECGKCNASPVNGNNRISVKLTECGELCFSQDDRDKAAKAWNRRAKELVPRELSKDDDAIYLDTEYSTRDYSVVFEEKLVEYKDATFFAERVFKIVKND